MITQKTAFIKITHYFIGILIGTFLFNCKATFNGDINFGDTSSGTSFSATIGGTITGMAGAETIQLINNGSEVILITGGGTGTDEFTFTQTVDTDDTYFVAVLVQPAGKTCSVGGAFGTVGDTNISTIEVNCNGAGGGGGTLTVGGNVTGLAGSGLIITNNLFDNRVIAGIGAIPFQFGGTLNTGDPYSVTVATQPSNPIQICTVTGGAGVMPAGNLTTVAINCVTSQYTIGGSVTGLTGVESVTLQNNGGDNLIINGAGGGADPYTMPTALDDGSPYAITVLTEPAGKTCTVGGGSSGNLAGANVNAITVACSAIPSYTVGGNLIGVIGSVTLQNNGGDNLVLAADGAFSFSVPILDGAAYNATILSQPTGPNQTCVVSSPSGNVSAGNVTTITVVCSTSTYTLGGSVGGLANGETVTLTNNYGETKIVTGGGTLTDPFTFATARNDGSYYNVTSASSSLGQTCIVGAGTGTIPGANITGINVTCSVSSNYTVTATVNGINGTVVLQNNGVDDISITANGSYTFATALATGLPYAVTVLTQPTNPIQACTITNGGGIIAAANINNINVICTTASFTVGGNVTGLAASEQVLLQNNAADNITIIGGGTSTDPFVSAPVNDQSAYAITVVTPPAGKTCTVGTGAGTVSGSNVTTVTVTCSATPTYSIGGSVAGYDITSSSLVLVNNGTDSLSVTANGGFTFGATQLDSSAYSVVVSQQPGAPNQACTVTNGAGAVATANVTNISITCITNQYSTSGSVNGLLNGEVVTLQNNGADNLNVTGGGTTIDPFSFATNITDGTGYNVTVLTSPAGKTCTVGAGVGTLAGSNINNVTVSCTSIPKYSVGGTVAGFTGLGLILQNNAGDNLAIGGNGAFTFPTTLLDGAGYGVTVLQNPASPNQTCLVTNGGGTIPTADVANVAINCTTTQYTVTATVSGIPPGSITILNNGVDAQVSSVDGAIVFSAQDDLTTYNVTVQTPPAGTTCPVGAGTGTVDGANVVNVNITCSSTATFTVGGTVLGLVGTGLVLQNNAGDDLVIAADGAYSFATALNDSKAYSVTVKTNPNTPAQTCSVVNAGGNIAAANIVNVNIICTTNSYYISGTVVGLVATVPGPLEQTILLYNGVAKLIDGDTPAYQMPQFNDGTSSDLQIVESPYGKGCTFDLNGLQVISPLVISGANVVNQDITCVVLPTASVTVNVSGLTSGTLSVVNSTNLGSQQNDFTADGAFVYTAQPEDSSYNISISSQPGGLTCGVTTANAIGNIPNPAAGVAVNISCSGGGGPTPTVLTLGTPTPGSASAGGTDYYSITGLTVGTTYDFEATNLSSNANIYVYSDSGYTALLCSSTGPGPVDEFCSAAGNTAYYISVVDVSGFGTDYNVRVFDSSIICGNSTTEVGETCDDGNTDSLDGCSSICQIESSYTVGGNIYGLNAGDTMTMQNGADQVVVPGAVADPIVFTYSVSKVTGDSYYATIFSYTSAGNICTVDNSTQTGIVGFANVTSIVVNCTAIVNYNVTINALGLGVKTINVELDANGAVPIVGGGSGLDSITFAQTVPDQTAFTVTITDGGGITCSAPLVRNGFINGTNVTIDVSCGTGIAADSFELDDTIADAIAKPSILAIDGNPQYRTLHNGATDFDVMMVNVTSTDLVYSFETFDNTGVGCALVSTIMILYDTDANSNVQLVQNFGGGIGDCAKINYKFPVPGIYYIEVYEAYLATAYEYSIKATTMAPIFYEDFAFGFGQFTSIDLGSSGAILPPFKTWFPNTAPGATDIDSVVGYTNWVPFLSDGKYVAFDSDAAGSGMTLFTELVSDSFSCSSFNSVFLEFDLTYRFLTGDVFTVEVDAGGGWQIVDTYAISMVDEHPVLDISLIAKGKTSVKVKFKFNDAGGWNYYGAIDNVMVTGY
ncbi:MAG: hypothetical protein ABUK01_09360 [Leptospirales bacterium]